MKSSKRHLDNAGQWSIRAVQLDVARHIESVDYICRYADFAARQGFNTLVLYLEGRVRAKSFPHRPPTESYSLKDMDRVVRHARAAGLDVVPVIASLAHAEQFLTCKEMLRLAEERDGRVRFGKVTPSTFCPSQEETYEFLERYFKELAAVFTGANWHVGLDEAWNLGYCNLCRERWAKDGLGSVFGGHIQRMERIVRGLGKRMWMWDDLFEYFPQELETTPRRAIQCHWDYSNQVELEGRKAHFVNRWQQDWLAVYEKKGIDAIICPANRYHNIRTFTDYARRHRVQGALLTQWEGSPRFWPGNDAVVSFGGHLWKSPQFDPETAWQATAREMLPNAQAPLVKAVQELISLPKCSYRPTGTSIYRWTDDETSQRSAMRMARELLRNERVRDPKQRNNAFLDDLDHLASSNLLLWDIRELELAINTPRRLTGDRQRLTRKLEACRAELERVRHYWIDYYDRVGNPDNANDRRKKELWRAPAAILASLTRILQQPIKANNWQIVLRLFLQDYYGAPHLKIEVMASARSLNVAEGSFKNTALIEGHTGGHYDLQIPFVWGHRPDGIRLTGWGYGGQGLAFVELQNPSITLAPDSIRSVNGAISHPEAALRDDASVVSFGCRDIYAALHNPALAEQRGVLELGLSPRR